jgi:uncharacterized protein with FMN-binding domain
MTAARSRPPLPPTPPYSPAPSSTPAASARTASSVRAPAPKRRNPARGAKAVALVSSLAATIGVAGALERGTTTGSVLGAGATSAGASAVTDTTAASSSSSATASSPVTTYANGVFTGTAQPTKWGPIQVQVTIRSGRIVSVAEIVSPADRKSQNINQQAAPILESEAIAVQSAGLDAVSGATWTSRTYTASLQAALDQARAAVTTKAG